MAEYVSSYGGEKIDELLGFVDELTVTTDELNSVSGVTGNVQDQINDCLVYTDNSVGNCIEQTNYNLQVKTEELEGLIKEAHASTSSSLVSSLTRHYKMNNSIDIPWESGTLMCDMNQDGSMFRLHGNAYHSSASSSWSVTEWIPGTDETWAGYKTFKVKAPSDGKVKWIDCAGMRINTAGSLAAGNFNYDHICIGTDGYIYVNVMNSKPSNSNPLMISYFGITCSVDSECDSGEYVLGNGA